MKKILTIVLFLSIYSASQACDICGCGVGNYYFGLMPQFRSKFFGLRYHINKFNTRMNDDPTQFSHDLYQTTEIWGGFNLGSKFQVIAIMPYNFNKQVSDDGTNKLNGLGDMMAMLNYKVYNHTRGRNYNSLWLGAGIKIPTGKFEIDPADPDVAAQANNQLGSGSVDFLLNGMYNIKVSKWGISTQAVYKINTANKENYQFGNKLTASSFISYGISSGNAEIRPNAGLLFENTEESRLGSGKVDLTGGNLLQGSIGSEFSQRKITLGFNVQLPIAQKFAEDQTRQKIKGMAHISFAL